MYSKLEWISGFSVATKSLNEAYIGCIVIPRTSKCETKYENAKPKTFGLGCLGRDPARAVQGQWTVQGPVVIPRALKCVSMPKYQISGKFLLSVKSAIRIPQRAVL